MPQGASAAARRRVVVLLSGAGSNLAALLDREDPAAEIVLVATDRDGVGGVGLAARAGVETATVVPADYPDRPAWEAALADRVATAQPDLVVLAGFMKVLSPRFVGRWPILNVHPSLLPAFPGARAVQAALDYGVKVTGATVHFVDEEVDHGPIVLQQAVDVLPDDDVTSLHARIKAVEHRLLGDAVSLFCNDRLRVDGRLVRSAW